MIPARLRSAVSLTVHYPEIRRKGTDKVAVLVSHHSRQLMQMIEIVRRPR